ncbi:MerR family transcriptional regulator [Streptomyces sp. NPDC002476]|uniref:MerR family transcriptional regulator n=1 Tax=Streptomyces sp. NPDC002476 TaxID=3364648 RepID=UPI0036AA0208
MSGTEPMTSDAPGRGPAFTGESAEPIDSYGLTVGGPTVGQAAALVGVSVKTLHHWDAIGLVCPSERTWAGYRVYSGDDVARIHQVRVYRGPGSRSPGSAGSSTTRLSTPATICVGSERGS